MRAELPTRNMAALRHTVRSVQDATCCIQHVTLQHGAIDEVLEQAHGVLQGAASTSSPMLYSPAPSYMPRSSLACAVMWLRHRVSLAPMVRACCMLHLFGSAAAFLSLRNDHKRTLGASVGLFLANAWQRRLPCHICTGTGEGACRATSALGLGKAPAV